MIAQQVVEALPDASDEYSRHVAATKAALGEIIGPNYYEGLGSDPDTAIHSHIIPGTHCNPLFGEGPMVMPVGWGAYRDPRGVLLDYLNIQRAVETRRQVAFAEFLDKGRSFLNRKLPLYADLQAYASHPPIAAANYALDTTNRRRKLSLIPLIMADMYGVDWEAAAPIMLSSEYVHTATLILDDLPQLDNDPVRRGKAATHVAYGESTAHHAAGTLLLHAASILVKLNTDQPTQARLQDMLDKSFEDTALGQMQELNLGSKRAATLRELERTSRLKTGGLFRYLLGSVAVYANVAEAETAVLGALANHIGVSYQIKNDLLDVSGAPADIGKLPGSDQRNGRPTYASALGADRAKQRKMYHDSKTMELLKRLSRKRDTGMLQKMFESLVEYQPST